MNSDSQHYTSSNKHGGSRNECRNTKVKYSFAGPRKGARGKVVRLHLEAVIPRITLILQFKVRTLTPDFTTVIRGIL